MPRKEPISKLEVIGQLEKNPDQAIGDFNESKQQEQYFIKEPQWDVPTELLESIVIRNSRDYYDLKNLQSEMLETTKIQRNVNKIRIKEMSKIQQELRERFVKTNVFIKECEEKTENAKNRIAENKKIQSGLDANINKLKVKIVDLNDFKEVLAGTVKRMIPYETVIQEYVDQSDVLKSVSDCMARSDALMLVQVEVNMHEENKTKEMEDLRKNLLRVTNEAALTVLGLNNELSQMERQYVMCRNECLKWEMTLTEIRNSISEKQLEEERLIDALFQMYRLLLRHSGRDAKYCRTDVENLFDVIREEVDILEQVLKIAKQELTPINTEKL
ncbi:CCDC42 family protein [Megaselia abdita]